LIVKNKLSVFSLN